MSVVAAYHILVCVLFLVQGGMWTDVQSLCFTWILRTQKQHCRKVIVLGT